MNPSVRTCGDFVKLRRGHSSPLIQRRRSKGARKAALERPRAPRPSKIGHMHRPLAAKRQPDDPMLAPPRAGERRDHRALRLEQIEKRPDRRLDDPVRDDLVESPSCGMLLEAVRPQDLDVGQPERLEPGRRPRRRESETVRARRPPSRTGRAKRCNSLFPFRFRRPCRVGCTSSAAIIAATIEGGWEVWPQPIGRAMSRPEMSANRCGMKSARGTRSSARRRSRFSIPLARMARVNWARSSASDALKPSPLRAAPVRSPNCERLLQS